MKYCIHCHATIENDAANFCPICGQAQSVGGQGLAAQPMSAPTNSPSAVPYGAPAEAAQMYAPPQEALRRVGMGTLVWALTSRLFFSLCVLTTVGVGLNLANAAISSMTLPSMAYALTGAPAISNIGFTIGLLIGQVFSILACVGLWMARSSAVQAQTSGLFNASGVRLYRTVLMVQLILVCVGFGFVLLLLILLAVVSGPDLFGGILLEESVFAVSGILWATVVCVVVVMVLTILLSVKQIKTITAIRTTAETGYPTTYVSQFVIVMYFLSGISSVLLALFSLPTLLTVSGAISFIAFLCSAAISLVYGIGLSKYKKAMLGVMQHPPLV